MIVFIVLLLYSLQTVNSACPTNKNIVTGALSGRYILRERDSNFCGDGCLYTKLDDPLSDAGQSFGYCFDLTSDCSCAGGCLPPPNVNNGTFTNCTLDGAPVTWNTTDEILPEGTECKLICQEEDGSSSRSFKGPAINDRYKTIRCNATEWRDTENDVVPDNIVNVCFWKDEMCHPPWTWKVPIEGTYVCNDVPDDIPKDELGRAVGFPEGSRCNLTCDNTDIGELVASEEPEGSIVCKPTPSLITQGEQDMAWFDRNDNILQLENIESICGACEVLPNEDINNGSYTCQDESLRVGTICTLNCTTGDVSFTPPDFPHSFLTCKNENRDLKWKDTEDTTFNLDLVRDACNFPCEDPNKALPVPNGQWNCEGAFRNVPDTVAGWSLGDNCTFQCLVNENVVNKTAEFKPTNYTIVCTTESWQHQLQNSTEPIDTNDEDLLCKIKSFLLTTVLTFSNFGQEIGTIHINRKPTKDLIFRNTNNNIIKPRGSASSSLASLIPTPAEQLNKENLLNLTEIIESNQVAKFALVEGTWMIRVQTENGDHFSQYGLYTISDADQIVNITMEYRSRLNFQVLNRLSNQEVPNSEVDCLLSNKSQTLEIDAEPMRQQCIAIMYDECMKMHNLTRDNCPIGDMPDYDLCKKVDGFDKYEFHWNVSRTRSNQPLQMRLRPMHTYNCTAMVKIPNAGVRADTSEILGFIPKSKEIKLDAAILNVTIFLDPDIPRTNITITAIDETGQKFTNYSINVEIIIANISNTEEMKVADEDTVVPLPIGEISITVLDDRVFEETTNISVTDKTTEVTLNVKRKRPFNMLLVDAQNDSPIPGIKVKFMRSQDADPRTFTEELNDKMKGFKSDLADKKKLIGENVSESVLQDPFEGYKFFGDETSFTDGNVSSTLYGGLWNAYIRSDDHANGSFTEGYFKNKIYGIQNYFRDFYFFQIYRKGFGLPVELKRQMKRQIVLSVAVFNDTCFNYCPSLTPCIAEWCHSMQINDDIRIEVKCQDCTADDEDTVKYLGAPQTTILQKGANKSFTIFHKQVVVAGKYIVKCIKLKNGKIDEDYFEAQDHIRIITENTYIPCLLHKKLEKTQLIGYKHIDKTPIVKIALGWDEPRIEIGNDFNLYGIMFDGDTRKAHCSSSHPLSWGECSLFEKVLGNQSALQNENELRVSDNPEKLQWECASDLLAWFTRDRCCERTPDLKQCVRDKNWKGLGFDTIVIGDKVLEVMNTTVMLVYVGQPHLSSEEHPTFKDASLEVSIQYSDKGKEFNDVSMIGDEALSHELATHNLFLFKCITITKDRIILSEPVNEWMHVEMMEFDLFDLFMKKDQKPNICEKCMELFCPHTSDSDGNDKYLTSEDKTNCCCCADLIQSKLNATSKAVFKCPYEEKCPEKSRGTFDFELFEEREIIREKSVKFPRVAGSDYQDERVNHSRHRIGTERSTPDEPPSTQEKKEEGDVVLAKDVKSDEDDADKSGLDEPQSTPEDEGSISARSEDKNDARNTERSTLDESESNLEKEEEKEEKEDTILAKNEEPNNNDSKDKDPLETSESRVRNAVGIQHTPLIKVPADHVLHQNEEVRYYFDSSEDRKWLGGLITNITDKKEDEIGNRRMINSLIPRTFNASGLRADDSLLARLSDALNKIKADSENSEEEEVNMKDIIEIIKGDGNSTDGKPLSEIIKEAGFDYQDIVSTDKSEETITDSNYDNDNVIITGAKVDNDETQETSSREFDDGIVREEKEFVDDNEDNDDNDDDDVVTNAIVETVSREANLSSDDQIDIEEEEFVDKDSQEYDRSESNYRYDDLLSQELPDKNTADTLEHVIDVEPVGKKIEPGIDYSDTVEAGKDVFLKHIIKKVPVQDQTSPAVKEEREKEILDRLTNIFHKQIIAPAAD